MDYKKHTEYFTDGGKILVGKYKEIHRKVKNNPPPEEFSLYDFWVDNREEIVPHAIVYNFEYISPYKLVLMVAISYNINYITAIDLIRRELKKLWPVFGWERTRKCILSAKEVKEGDFFPHILYDGAWLGAIYLSKDEVKKLNKEKKCT